MAPQTSDACLAHVLHLRTYGERSSYFACSSPHNTRSTRLHFQLSRIAHPPPLIPAIEHHHLYRKDPPISYAQELFLSCLWSSEVSHALYLRRSTSRMQSAPISTPREFWSGCLRQRLADIQDLRSLDDSGGSAWARRIDDELAAMHLAMCALRTERNTLARVYRLPSEVLARIFLFCSGTLPSMTPEHAELGWIQVTHVCKYWRDAALHYPHLWTNIHHGLNARWLKVMLTRAKSAPISLNFNNSYSLSLMPASHLEEITKHLFRVRDIFVTIEHPATWVPILTSSASALQRLRLYYPGGSTYICLPDNTFQDRAPVLRFVDLENVYIRWSAPILRHVTCLKVTLSADSTPHMLGDNIFTTTSFDPLLIALRGFSTLKTLELMYCLPPVTNAYTGHPADLPSLESLSLDDDISRCDHLMKNIRIPPSCKLSLVCTGTGERQCITDIVSFFHDHVDRKGMPLQSVELEAYESCSVFRASRMAGDDMRTQLWYTLKLYTPEDPSKSIWDTMTSLYRGLPTDSIRHLTVTGRAQDLGSNWSAQDWINVLGKSRMVEEVQFDVDLYQLLEFCTALASRVDQEGGVLFFENLCRLTLGANGAWFYGIDEGKMRTVYFEAFLKQIDARQKARAIQTICFEAWPDARKEMLLKRLLEIVPQVEWDTWRRA